MTQETELKTQKCGILKGKIIGHSSAMSGEIGYSLAVTEFGGLWVKGDWVSDTVWTSYGIKALEKNHPALYKRAIEINKPYSEI